MKQQELNYQWFIITAIGGQEDSISNSLKEKLINFGFESYVKEIKVFKEVIVSVEDFSKNSPDLPSVFRNTRTIKWEVLGNGNYRKTKTKTVNKFPGYIFINMVMQSNIWYAIRNTIGVLGFVGSSGKGSFPVPITIEEYNSIVLDETSANAKTDEKNSNVKIEKDSIDKRSVEKPKTIFQCDFKVGQEVTINKGNLAGTDATVMSINIEKGLVTVEYEFFGRVNPAEIPIEDVNLKK